MHGLTPFSWPDAPVSWRLDRVLRGVGLDLRHRQAQAREDAGPGRQREEKTGRAWHADDLREDVVAVRFDAAQDVLVDRAHDLRRDETPRVSARQRQRRAVEVLARSRDL